MMLAKQKIGLKLGLGFGLALVGLVGLTGFAIWRMGTIQAGLQTVYEDRVEPLNELKKVADMYAVNIVDNSHKARNGNVTFDEAIKNIEAAQTTISEQWDAYLDAEKISEEKALIEETKPLVAQASAAADKLIGILKAKDQKALDKFTIDELYPAIDPVSEKISGLVELQLAVAKKEYDKGQAVFASSVRALMIVSFFVIFAVIWLATAITREILRPVHALRDGMAHFASVSLASLSQTAEQLRAGNVVARAEMSTSPIAVKGHDEIATMGESFNQMLVQARSAMNDLGSAQGNLADMLHELRDSAKTVSRSGDAIADNSGTVSSAAADISATVNEVTHAIEQSAITSQDLAANSESLAHGADRAAQAVATLQNAIRELASGASQQHDATDQAQQVAQNGTTIAADIVAQLRDFQERVDGTSEFVSELGAKQEKIGEIVQTIDEIAAQTNLLALNAAIEAARAGEHGRGFAVVAEEVRKLAERSSHATTEIGELINAIRAQVDEVVSSMAETAAKVREGAKRSEGVQAALDEIFAAVDTVGEIATSNMSNARAMEQQAEVVAEAVRSVAAASEQSAASAQELSATNEELTASIEQVSAEVQSQSNSARELDAMSQDLRSTAERLLDLASQFRFEADEGPSLRLAA